jgi:hypothetical protein
MAASEDIGSADDDAGLAASEDIRSSDIDAGLAAPEDLRCTDVNIRVAETVKGGRFLSGSSNLALRL